MSEKKRGKWRVDWYGRNGCIRQEWFATEREAIHRAGQLWRGRIRSEIFRELTPVSNREKI